MDDSIECVFHHGGKFINDGTLKYEGETTTLSFDPNIWSYFVDVGVLKSFGYDNFKYLWYCVGGGLVLKNRLEQLIDDIGAMHMANLARLNGEVHLYVVHVASESEVMHLLQYISNDEVEGNGEVQKKGEEHGDGVEVDGDLQEVHEGEEDGDLVEVYGEGDGDLKKVEEGDGVQVHVEGDGDLEEVHEGEEARDGVQVDVEGDGVQVDVEGNVQVDVEGDGVQVDVEGDVVQVDVEADVKELHQVEEEQELNVCEGIMEDEVDVCSWTTSTDEGDVHGNNECLEELVDVSVECDINGVVDGNMEVEVEAQSLYDSDYVSAESDDDDDDDRGLSDEEWNSEELLSATDSDEDVNDSEGYGRFGTFCMPKSMVDFKGYALENVRNIKFVKNDKRRLRLKCFGAKGECPWTIYFGYMEAVKSWQLRTKKDIHTCSREFNLKLLDAKWLSKKLVKTVRENPKMKGVDIREKIQRKWNIGISRCMAYRAKVIASDHIDGNPGSTIKVHVEDIEGERFMDMVFDLLIDDLGGQEVCSSITFVSDQQKGLLPAIQELLPGVDQRFCVRHLYSNFRKKFPELTWRVTTTTHPQNWEREMRNLKHVNEDTFKHLIVIPPRFLNIDGAQFTLTCFLKSTYEQTYASIVYPINSNNMWDLTPYLNVMPPRKKVMPGRPKRKKRLEQWEIIKDSSRMSKGGLCKRCEVCREVGHNRSHCPKATQDPIMMSSQLSSVSQDPESQQ
ncbi:hypothetical protein V8G54_021141 [Vigna mungo]|uniref:PB1-like domain-containing protein n=1 Tax=Vigna mungo TaxID=3915 RepID=A0AAQ3NF14_VIGMU